MEDSKLEKVANKESQWEFVVCADADDEAVAASCKNLATGVFLSRLALHLHLVSNCGISVLHMSDHSVAHQLSLSCACWAYARLFV